MWMVYKYTPIQSIEGYEGLSNRWKRESLEIWIVWPRRLQLDSWPAGRTSACSFRTRRTLVLRLVQLSLKRGGNAIMSGAVRKCHPIWKVGYIGKASRNSSVYFNIYGSSISTRLCAFNFLRNPLTTLDTIQSRPSPDFCLNTRGIHLLWSNIRLLQICFRVDTIRSFYNLSLWYRIRYSSHFSTTLLHAPQLKREQS